MPAEALPVAVVTAFWFVVGGILPFIVAKGPNKGVTQVVLVITACSCWLFWMCCYLHQMNPMIGPVLHNTTIIAVQYLWDGTLDPDEFTTTPVFSSTEASTVAAN